MNKRALLYIAVLLLLSSLPAFASSGLKSELEQVYKGKQLMLRQPDAANEIDFNEQGTRVGAPKAGIWYENLRFEWKDTKVSENKLTITGKRLIYTFSLKDNRFVAFDAHRKIRINIALKPGADENDVKSVLAKIFMTKQDSLADVAPDYWETCLRGELKDATCKWEGHDEVGTSTHWRPEDFRTSIEPKAAGHRTFGNVTPPKTIHDPDPQYTALALERKYQGTTVLRVLIGVDGKPTKIRIVRPIGFGLDDKAVDAVREWRFQPATKDGQPVAVQVMIEVNFRTY